MSQAIALMPSLNIYGTVTEGDSSTSAVDTAAETFVTAGLSKVLKINNICYSNHLEDCGIPTEFTTFAGSTVESFSKTIRKFNPAFYASDITDNNGNTYSFFPRVIPGRQPYGCRPPLFTILCNKFFGIINRNCKTYTDI